MTAMKIGIVLLFNRQIFHWFELHDTHHLLLQPAKSDRFPLLPLLPYLIQQPV
jgi:hypothetical protein